MSVLDRPRVGELSFAINTEGAKVVGRMATIALAASLLGSATAAPLRTPVLGGIEALQDWTQQTVLRVSVVPTEGYLIGTLSPFSVSGIESANETRKTSTSDQIQFVHHASGLTWEQLSRLFGVSRRSLHSWANGARMSASNVERVAQVNAVLEDRRGFSSEENRLWLLAATPGSASRFDQLRGSWVQGNIVEDTLGVRERLGLND